jgi:hypothetical protein
MTPARVARSGTAAVFALSFAATPAVAGFVDTPDCRAALADANHLVRAVQARQAMFAPNDPLQNCRLLRANLDDMIGARDPMNRCLTGHDQSENVGQMDASIEDIRAVLIANCRR